MKEVILLIFGMILLFIGMFGLGFILDKHRCEQRTAGIGEHEWGIIKGCLVKPDGESNFIPLSNYRVL